MYLLDNEDCDTLRGSTCTTASPRHIVFLLPRRTAVHSSSPLNTFRIHSHFHTVFVRLVRLMRRNREIRWFFLLLLLLKHENRLQCTDNVIRPLLTHSVSVTTVERSCNNQACDSAFFSPVSPKDTSTVCGLCCTPLYTSEHFCTSLRKKDWRLSICTQGEGIRQKLHALFGQKSISCASCMALKSSRCRTPVSSIAPTSLQ